jgi:hypothetical protein
VSISESDHVATSALMTDERAENTKSAINADLQVWETRMLYQIYCKVVPTDEALQNLAGQ